MDLFKIMRRLLEFSGSEVTSVSESSDGFVFDVEVQGKEMRVFVTDKTKFPTHQAQDFPFPEDYQDVVVC